MSLSTQTLNKDIEGTNRSQEDLHNAVRNHHYVRSTEQAFLPVYKGSRIANPSPLAFSALATALYIIGVVALGADDLKSLGVIPSVGLGYSAVALLVAGLWQFPSGQVWGASLYTTASGFFFSLVLLLSPWSGVSDAYASSPEEFGTAVSQFMFSWFITFVIFTIAAHRSSGGLLAFLTLVNFTLLFLALTYRYPTHPKLLTTAGSFSILAAFVGWYATLASLLTAESSLFRLPTLGDLSPKNVH